MLPQMHINYFKCFVLTILFLQCIVSIIHIIIIHEKSSDTIRETSNFLFQFGGGTLLKLSDSPINFYGQ